MAEQEVVLAVASGDGEDECIICMERPLQIKYDACPHPALICAECFLARIMTRPLEKIENAWRITYPCETCRVSILTFQTTGIEEAALALFADSKNNFALSEMFFEAIRTCVILSHRNAFWHNFNGVYRDFNDDRAQPTVLLTVAQVERLCALGPAETGVSPESLRKLFFECCAIPWGLHKVAGLAEPLPPPTTPNQLFNAFKFNHMNRWQGVRIGAKMG